MLIFFQAKKENIISYPHRFKLWSSYLHFLVESFIILQRILQLFRNPASGFAEWLKENMQIPQFWHTCVVFFFVFLARVVRFSTISLCASRQCLSCLFPGYLVAEAAEIGFLLSFDIYPFAIKLVKAREKARYLPGFGISELRFCIFFCSGAVFFRASPSIVLVWLIEGWPAFFFPVITFLGLSFRRTQILFHVCGVVVFECEKEEGKVETVLFVGAFVWFKCVFSFVMPQECIWQRLPGK